MEALGVPQRRVPPVQGRRSAARAEAL